MNSNDTSILGNKEPNEQQQRLWEMQHRMAMIEAFRQGVATSCATAMCVKLDDEHINAVDVARRAKKIADALTREFFGDDANG